MSPEEARQRMVDAVEALGPQLAQLRDPQTLEEFQGMHDLQATMDILLGFVALRAQGYECRVVSRYVLTDVLGRAWHHVQPGIWQSPHGACVSLEGIGA